MFVIDEIIQISNSNESIVIAKEKMSQNQRQEQKENCSNELSTRFFS